MAPKPINICFISHDSNLYGAELSLIGILKYLNKEQYNPTVIIPGNGPLVEELEANSINYIIGKTARWVPYRREKSRYHLKTLIKELPRRIRNIREIIRDKRIHLVYTNTITNIDGAIAAFLENVPHVWHIRENIRGNAEINPYLPLFLVRLMASWISDRIITNSTYLKNEIRCFGYKDKIDVIYNGINLKPYACDSFSPNSLKKELSIPEENKIVAIIGQISHRKGHHVFIEAAKSVIGSCKDVVFVIVGTGSTVFLESLKTKIQSFNMNQRFYFLGYRKDIPAIMKSIDLLVLSSEQEPFGRVIIEAMAASLPVVSTRCGGPEEIIIDQETGFLVPVGNAHAMAQAIVEILKNRNLAMRMGLNARRRAEEVFDIRQHVEKIETVIADVIHRA